MERKRTRKLSEQVEEKINNPNNYNPAEYDGTGTTVSTGSTLLDLAISGGRFREGGIPLGILVEVFGPSGAGKTVILSQIAGNLQAMGGVIKFHDPEARLNKQFARIFGLDTGEIEYTIPDTIPEVFQSIRNWVPDKEDDGIYGAFADSLAALSTDMEMNKDTGDKMGMRRAKEFSEELRKTCRIFTQRNVLMVCSNQIRQNHDAGPYGMRYKSPGGEAIGFYSSLRLRCLSPQKIKEKRKIKGKEHERVIGVRTEIEVFKSSVWKPYRTAEIYILFNYGIDDIRGNLRYVKTVTGDTVYRIGDTKLSKSLNESILIVEEDGLEQELKEEVINLWNEVEAHFKEERKPRR
ncbi:MAG: recombinase A [Spirochaetes bacterium ADurb.Bin001]|nr:MAG: recombinase A [Spirochaetes bacterium ADurb.Bin001]